MMCAPSACRVSNTTDSRCRGRGWRLCAKWAVMACLVAVQLSSCPSPLAGVRSRWLVARSMQSGIGMRGQSIYTAKGADSLKQAARRRQVDAEKSGQRVDIDLQSLRYPVEFLLFARAHGAEVEQVHGSWRTTQIRVSKNGIFCKFSLKEVQANKPMKKSTAKWLRIIYKAMGIAFADSRDAAQAGDRALMPQTRAGTL
eukprot:TRINITY_DN83214_c0_g1_i1.p1 TRINITY_DN83214_c0_g1~~TRINITY_DN83214_c0_g1_i1.p1  ORF type:complete len:199 (-),score=31.16 TRINITY_DN83214_c0_g1_i1:259-855(-)